jgi:hypothetical protein
MGRSRGGLTSKIYAVGDTNDLPVRLTAGEAHDNRLAGKLLSRLKSATMLLADRGYDADWIRAPSQHLRKHSGGEFRGSTNEPPSFTCCVDGDWETAPVARISGAVSLSDAFALSRLRTAIQNM